MADLEIQLDNLALEAVEMAGRKNAFEEVMPEFNEDCMAECPVGETGNLRRTHGWDHNGDWTEAWEEATASYAASVHDGARAHIIPNAFGRGEPVEHPGNKENPWIRRTSDRYRAAGTFE